jgi:large subunit ribosomal protein L22
MAAVEEPRTQVRAEARYVRTAPRKAQLVTEQIRGRTVPEARTILAFMTRDAARDVERVLSSAVANAEANHNLDGDELYVSVAVVGAGPTLKRWRARARGRVARIKKRTCHITIALALPEGGVIPAPRPAPAPAPAAEPPAEEETKPERAPREKAEEKPAAGEAPAAEEKPKAKRKPATKPKGDEPKAEAKPKPKRTATRKKKAEDT